MIFFSFAIHVYLLNWNRWRGAGEEGWEGGGEGGGLLLFLYKMGEGKVIEIMIFATSKY